jgi:hypothetical protein
MARASTIAFVALVLALTTAQVWADDELSLDDPVPAATTAAPAPKKAKTLTRHFWQAGGVSWTEDIKLKRADGAKFNLLSSILGVDGGYNWITTRGRWGRDLQVDGIVGQASYESHDPSLSFFRNREMVMAGSVGYNFYYMLLKPNIWIGGGANAMVRHVAYHNPSGYGLSDESNRLIGTLRFDFAFPLAKKVLLVQQLGIPLIGSNTFWMLGLRF